MKRIILISCITILLKQIIFAQTSILQTSSANEGIGNASATLSNYGSIYTNVAGLADINTMGISASYRVAPTTLWQNSTSLNGLIPSKIGTFGLGIARLGDNLFNQQLYVLGFANRFGIASIGLKANMMQYNIEGYGSKSFPYFEIGGIVELTPQLFIGAYIINFTQTKIDDFENEYFPTIINAGISYRPMEKLMINIEVEQDIDYQPTFKAGLGYHPIKNLSLRTGVNTSPNRQYFGIGFRPNNIALQLDYSLSHDIHWGIAHQMSVYYNIKKASR